MNERKAPPKKFGKALTKYRTDANLTQKDMADRLGVTKSRLCSWEYHERAPNSILQEHYLRVALDIAATEVTRSHISAIRKRKSF